HILHFFGDDALARKMHLREIPRAAVHRGGTIFDPRIPQCHKSSLKKSAGGHARRNAASLSHPDSHPATRVRVQTARDFCARSKRRCRAFSSVAHLLTEAQRVYRGGAEESDEMHGTEIFARGNSACRDSKRGLRASRHLALQPWKNHHPD